MSKNNFIIFILSLIGILTTQITNAQLSELDEALWQEGIIDSNYKYTDMEAANKAFRDINNEMASSLPVKLSSEIEISTIFMTPHASFYSYRYLVELNEDQKKYLKIYLNSESKVAEFCEGMFTENFLIANDHTFNLSYRDINERTITVVKLTPSKCNLIGPTKNKENRQQIGSYF